MEEKATIFCINFLNRKSEWESLMSQQCPCIKQTIMTQATCFLSLQKLVYHYASNHHSADADWRLSVQTHFTCHSKLQTCCSSIHVNESTLAHNIRHINDLLQPTVTFGIVLYRSHLLFQSLGLEFSFINHLHGNNNNINSLTRAGLNHLP